MKYDSQGRVIYGLPHFLDDEELRFGTGGDDMSMYHDGTDNFIDANNGTFLIRCTDTDETLALQTFNGGTAENRFLASSTTTNIYDEAGVSQLTCTSATQAAVKLPGTSTFRQLSCAFGPYKLANENASRDITRDDVGTSLNCASGSVTFTFQDVAEAGWLIGDTIEVTAQTSGVVTMVAEDASNFRTWRGDGAAITTTNSLTMKRGGRVVVQYIGSDLWDVIHGNDCLNAHGPDWTVTNVSTNRSCDANGLLAAIGDNLATLINDLIAKGILQ